MDQPRVRTGTAATSDAEVAVASGGRAPPPRRTQQAGRVQWWPRNFFRWPNKEKKTKKICCIYLPVKVVVLLLCPTAASKEMSADTAGLYSVTVKVKAEMGQKFYSWYLYVPLSTQ